jgi:translocation and assembly module TamB
MSEQEKQQTQESSTTEQTPQAQKRRRFFTFKKIFGLLIVGLIVFVVGLLAAYRFGYIDSYIESRIVNKFDQYGVRAEIEDFQTTSSPKTATLRNVKFYDKQTNELLGKLDKAHLKFTILDLLSLSLTRNIRFDTIEVDGAEVWIKFDKDGNSSFRNLRRAPSDPRLKLDFLAAKTKLNGAKIHFDDKQHELAGEARNIAINFEPEDITLPEDERRFKFNFKADNSTFVYDGKPIDNISIDARGVADKQGADIQEMVLRSPIAESSLVGKIDDWQKMSYRFDVKSSVDLTQASDILQTEAALRGVGNFNGKVTGEGADYKVEGEITSDALAADNIRLKALKVNANAKGNGASYEANGKAVAELLTAGDYQFNYMQIIGNVYGTGTDFRWLGEMHAAAAKIPGGATIAGLIVYDAVAESKDDVIDVTAKRGTAKTVMLKDTQVNNVQANDIKSKTENGVTNATVANATSSQVKTKDLNIKGVSANKIKVFSREGGPTDVDIGTIRVDGIEGLDAKIGSMNIAGVRLGIYKGRVEGKTGDIDVGTVALDKTKNLPDGGKVEKVKLTKPIFVLEPNDRYRASMDLSLGGGVLGSMNLGAARAALIVTNEQIEVKNFTASIMNGNAEGNAVISTNNGTSRVNSNFNDLDVGKLVTLFANQVVPLTGKTNGDVALSFQGMNVKETATGKIRATFNTEAGDDTRGRTPLNGVVELDANRGLFEIARAELNSAASHLIATGKFSFASNDSDLNLNLTSTDASELQRIATATGALDDVEEDIEENKIAVVGVFNFNGKLRGKLDNPSVEGRAFVESLSMQEHEVGSLSLALNVTPDNINIRDGKLSEKDGGGVTFALNAPRSGTNNISVQAKLENANGRNLIATLPKISKDTRESLRSLRSDISGDVNIVGLPDAMDGNANLFFSHGEIKDEPFESIAAKAKFNGTTINLEEVDARFDAGRVIAKGTVDPKTFVFNLEAEGNNIQLEKIKNLTIALEDRAKISGVFNINAKGSGNLLNNDFTTLNVNFDGVGDNVKINNQSVGKVTLVGRTENKRVNANITTDVFVNPQTLTAIVNLENRKLPTTIQSSFTGADLSLLFKAFMPPNSVDVNGQTSGSIAANVELLGENEEGEEDYGFYNLSGTANFSELTFNVEEIPFSAVTPLAVQLMPTELSFNQARFTGPGTNLFLNGTASIREGGQNNLSMDGSVNLRLLNTLSPNVFFNGATDVAMRVVGSHNEPRLTGSANLNGATVATLISNERLTLSNIKGRAIFNLNQIQIESVTGNLGGGRVNLAGGVLLERFSPSRFRFELEGNNVTAPFPKNFRTTADGQIEINGSRNREQLVATIISGRLNVLRSEYRQEIDIADLINQRVEGTLTEGASSTASLVGPTQLDLYLDGRDSLVVNNNIADMLGSIALRVSGPLESPIISGRITATRGFVKFRDKRYELQRAFVDIPPQDAPDPILNINAETEIRGYTLFVTLTGALTELNASVRSDPPLPQADVVSLITTGDLAKGDSGLFATAQPGITTAANLLADTLIAAPARRATDKLFGLSRLELEPVISERGAQPTARLTVGRQITKDLSIAYSTNITADKNQVVVVEYRVSNRLSFVAQYEQGSVTGINTRTNNFSFEVKFRKRF